MIYDYFANDGRDSNSSLKQFRSNRKIYRDIYIDMVRKAKPPTKAMLFGTAFHSAILEPEQFAARYVVDGKKWGRGKKDLAEKAEIGRQRESAGQVTITQDDFDTIDAMVAAVKDDEFGAWVVDTDGIVEEPVFWADPETGLLMKCKPDKLIVEDDEIVICDFKKVGGEGFGRFAWACLDLQYDFQAALYIDGVRASLDLPLDFPIRFFLIPVTDTEPECKVCEFQVDDLDRARKLNEKTLRELADCKSRDEWEKPSKIEFLHLPRRRI